MNLDQALRHASDEVTKSVAAVEPGPVPQPVSSRPLRRSVLITLALAAAAAVVLLPLARSGDSSEVATSPGDERSVAREAEADGASESISATRVVTDAIPPGLSSTFTSAVADLTDTLGHHRRHVYGVAGREPTDDDPHISVTFDSGLVPPVPSDAQVVDVDGRDGFLVADDVLVLESGPYTVAVRTQGLTVDELIGLASALSFADDGQPLPLDGEHHGLRFLAAVDKVYHEDIDGAAAVDGQVSVYRQGFTRYLDLVTSPAPAGGLTYYLWAFPEAVTSQVGEREVLVLADHQDFGSSFWHLVWLDGQQVVEAVGLGLTQAEVEDAVAASRRANGASDLGATADVVSPPEPGPDLSTLAATRGFVTLDPPPGLVVVLSADHDDLGPSDWDSTEYLYTPAGVDEPGPDDPILLISVTPLSTGLLIGEPVEIGGIDGVIVDQEAAGTPVDVELGVADRSVQFRSLANLSIEDVLAVAETYVDNALALGETTPGHTLGFGLTARSVRTLGVWSTADISGEPGESTVHYGSNDDRDLYISTLSGGTAAIDFFRWRYPAAAPVEVGDAEGLLVEPVDGLVLLRLLTSGGDAVELIGVGLSHTEVLAAAAALEPID